LRRIARSIALVLAIAVSLLVFPSALLWMVAFWLAVAGVAIGRNRTAWLPLAACVAVLLVKRPDWSPGLMLLAASMAAVAAILFWMRISGETTGGRSRLALVAIGVLWVLWAAAVWGQYSDSHAVVASRLDPTRPIVCLGDSLTTGLSDDEAYPLYLQQLVSVPVLNFGHAGITARDALKHMPAALANHPQAVVVELGGHDFLRGYSRETARASLVEIIDACCDAGAAVILMEIPRGFITDSFSGLERELTRKYDLELIPDSAIRMLVVRSPAIPIIGELAVPHLSDDGLHPNVTGARYLAKSVYQSLLRMYGPDIAGK
jgi:lysophospholipase L1-like esterase